MNELVAWCEDAHIPVVTVWALSQQNLHRGAASVHDIMCAVTDGLQTMASTGRWRIRPIGALERLPPEHTSALRTVEADTRHNHGITLNVAVAYSGRDDILRAILLLLRQIQHEPHATPEITEQHVAQHLSTAGQPDVDLVIRTSGEQRLSGFMSWQAGEAELYFTDTAWPAFDRSSFDRALRWYAGRELRSGR